ncbi:MAG: hypothetical protein AB7N76_21755 [Planctomycetota bacterium]
MARPILSRLFLPLLLLLALLAPTPARADEVSDLLAKLEAAGARVVSADSQDPRLREGRVTVGVGQDGKVEVYVPSGPGGVRTPLRSPTERLSLSEFRALVSDMRREVRELYGIEVERVYVAGSSSGIPFHAPNGEVRTFDRKGAGTSDYDGALVSKELFAKVQQEQPRTIRGQNTGKRTAPDPLPALRTRFEVLSQAWGRHVAGMVYASPAEFEKRMNLTGLKVGVNVMPEPGPDARYVEPTRAEVLGALVEVETLKRLIAARGRAQAEELAKQARAGDPAAEQAVRKARQEAAKKLAGALGLGEVDTATLQNEAKRLGAPSGFAGERPVARGPPAPWAGSEDALRALFAEVREGTAARASERLATLAGADLDPAARAELEGRVGAVADARLELVSSDALLVDWVPERNAVRVSTGVLNRLEALEPGQRAKVLELLLAHELAHSAGVVAERVADAEAVKVVERAAAKRGAPLVEGDVRAAIDLFHKGGSRLQDALYALKELPTYGTPGARREGMLRALRGEADPLQRFRRGDGTLDWQRLTRERALAEAGGAAHFALALFLKELAVVVKTGDRQRIEEFFDGLLTTDFFATYGLFAVGARAGEVAYARFLGRYLKPGFVSGVLRTNVVLATGMLLPELVHGRLDGRAFAIDLASLGLSSTAVEAGVAGLRWVVNLRRGDAAAQLARAGAGLSRLAKVGRFLYTAAETAVVLYVADELGQALTHYLDERDARSAVRDAALEARDAARDPARSAVELRQRLDDLAAAHQAWRNFLLRPVAAAEALYQQRLERAARKAKLLADQRAAAQQRVEAHPALRKSIEARAGSVAAWAESLQREDQAEVERDLTEAMQTLERSRADALRAAYGGARRADPYLADASLSGDGFWPYLRLRSEARQVSENRLQAYEDEERLLSLLRPVASAGDKAAAVDEALTFTRALRRADEELVLGKGAAGVLRDRR